MTAHLTLVSDRSGDSAAPVTAPARVAAWVHAAWSPSPKLARTPRVADLSGADSGTGLPAVPADSVAQHPAGALADDRGAVTAEYAVVIIGAAAFAGPLRAILRSGEIRQMLVDLVQNALGSAG